MANEIIVTDLLGNGGDPIEYTCADGTGIAKGCILELTDPRTVQAVSGVDTPLVGIAAHEKVASDGATTISVLTNFIGKGTTAAGGTATLGDGVSIAAAGNTLDLSATLDVEKGWSLGYSLETVGNAETFLIRVRK